MVLQRHKSTGSGGGKRNTAYIQSPKADIINHGEETGSERKTMTESLRAVELLLVVADVETEAS